MLRVTVKLFGTLRRLSQAETPGLWQGSIPDGTCISDLITMLGTKEAEVAAASLNGVVVPLDTGIPDEATIMLVTPVGGGAVV